MAIDTVDSVPAEQQGQRGAPVRRSRVSPWSETLVVWLISRCLCIAALYAGSVYFPVRHDYHDVNPHAGSHVLPGYFSNYARDAAAYGRYPMVGVEVGGDRSWLKPFVRWDAVWYMSIVDAGYVADLNLNTQRNVAFFPLYPLLIRGLGLAGVNHILAAIVISNLALLLAAYFLFRLVQTISGAKAARWTLLFWLCYPTAFFGCVPYAEALLALCIVLVLLNVMRDRFVIGGIWGAVAAATRPTGLALGAAFVPGLLARHKWKALLGMALCAASVALYFGYLGYKFGDPFLYLHTEWVAKSSDGNSLNPLIWAKKLLIGACTAIRLLILREPAFDLFSGRLTDPFLYLWILAWLPSVRRLGSEAAWFSAALCAMPLATLDTVASLGRYSWMVLPVFIVQGVKLKKSKYRFVLLAASSTIMIWLSALYGGGWLVI